MLKIAAEVKILAQRGNLAAGSCDGRCLYNNYEDFINNKMIEK